MPQFRRFALLLWPLALVLVTWTLSQMPLAGIGSSLSGIDWYQWLAWILVNVLVVIVATERWRVLTRLAGGTVSFMRLLIIRQAGQTISFITPGPQFGGEPFQIYWLYKHTGMAIHRAVLSLGLDRFYELWINFLILVLGVVLLLLATDSNLLAGTGHWQQILLVLVLLLLMLSTLAFFVFRQPALITASLEKLSRRWLDSPRLSSLNDHWQSMGTDLRAAFATQKPALFYALLLSALGWVLIVFEMWLVLIFFGITPDFNELILVLVAMRLALLLPLPGGIGTLEAAIFWSFQLLAFSPAAALAVIALMRLRDVLVLLAGVLCVRLAQNSRSS